MPAATVPIAPTGHAGLAAMLVTSASAVPLIALQQLAIGLGVLAVGLLLAFLADRTLARTLAVVAVGLVILSVTSLEADLTDLGMLRFTLVLGGAVLVPTLLARLVEVSDVRTLNRAVLDIQIAIVIDRLGHASASKSSASSRSQL